jgi:protein TonB
MTTTPPVPFLGLAARAAKTAPGNAPRIFVPSASYRYDPRPRSRKVMIASVAFSTAIHVGVLFGIGPAAKKPARVVEDTTITLNLEFTEIKELEETEPVVADDPAAVVEPGDLVPMLADSPQVPQLTDFVQQLDFASLIEQPHLNTANIVSIPSHISRGGKIGEGMGPVFNLSDLDRPPTAVFQPVPLLPKALKEEPLVATVRVQFIVASDGRVVNGSAVESTDYRFNEPAIKGVEKWKFKPGMKGGRKVNTWMVVPIVFNVGPDEE